MENSGSQAQASIQLATLLGNFWGEATALALESLKLSAERSPDLGEGIIRPDYLVKERNLAVCVTATDSTQTFMRKRWRYVNVVFQLKALFGAKLRCINLVYSNPDTLREGGIRVLDEFFDRTILVASIPEFSAVREDARVLLANDNGVKITLRKLRRDEAFRELVGRVAAHVQEVMEAVDSSRDPLWQTVQEYAQTFAPTPLERVEPTYFRRVCLKLLPFTEAERKQILASALTGQIIAPLPILEQSSIRFVPVIGGRMRIVDPEFTATLRNGFGEADVIETCAALDEEALQRGFPVDELQRPEVIVPRARRMLQVWPDKGSLTDLALEQFFDEDCRRVWLLEYLMVVRGASMLQTNDNYLRTYGRLGVTNPVDNVVLKTDIGQSIATNNADIRELFSRICNLLLPKGLETPTLADVKTAVQAYRWRSLLLQPYLNPTRFYFEALCNELGIEVALLNSSSLLNDLGLKGRGTRVEGIYRHDSGTRPTYFKVLSGYVGGYEHKADEMSARSWLLRFRRVGEEFHKTNAQLIFVHEGEWSTNYLSMLMASGWDRVIPLTRFESEFSVG